MDIVIEVAVEAAGELLSAGIDAVVDKAVKHKSEYKSEYRRKHTMAIKSLIINPGSTSTKIGVFEDENLLFEETLPWPAVCAVQPAHEPVFLPQRH